MESNSCKEEEGVSVGLSMSSSAASIMAADELATAALRNCRRERRVREEEGPGTGRHERGGGMEEGHLSEGERQAERDKQKTEISRLSIRKLH